MDRPLDIMPKPALGPPKPALDRPLDIMMVAGEPSGDALGGRLMAALAERTGGAVGFRGVGGERMLARGLDHLFPMAELSVMGLVEVLPRAPHLLRRVRDTVHAVRAARPDALVTIDAPGFNFRVGRRLAGAGIPLIHYVAPSVWAWRPGRARKIARFLDHLLAVLPFEPPYFEDVGLPCTFVGHPVVEEGAGADGAAFRARHDIAPGAPLLALLPGSRRGEIERLLPRFAAAAARLAARMPELRVVVPTVPAVADAVERGLAAHGRAGGGLAARGVGAIVLRESAEKADAFAASDAALAASGTVTLELAMAEVPMVVAYRMNPATVAVVRRLVSVDHVCLVNLIVGRGVVPEFIQEACTPDRLEAALARILVDRSARDVQIEAAREVRRRLRRDVTAPSHRAAQVVLDVLSRQPTSRLAPTGAGQ